MQQFCRNFVGMSRRLTMLTEINGNITKVPNKKHLDARDGLLILLTAMQTS